MFIEPGSPEELAGCLAESNAARRSLRLGGHFTKDGMAGPLVDADVTISTRRMDRILIYEPADPAAPCQLMVFSSLHARRRESPRRDLRPG